jgi:hypothetical protein
MAEIVSESDRTFIERLLSMLAYRVCGAIDMGTLGYFTSVEVPAFDLAAFIEEHYAKVMRAILIVLRASTTDGEVPARGKSLDESVERFLGALVTLQRFAEMAHDDLRAATEALSVATSGLRSSIAQLSMCLSVKDPFSDTIKADKWSYYVAILDKLLVRLEHVRETGRIP